MRKGTISRRNFLKGSIATATATAVGIPAMASVNTSVQAKEQLVFPEGFLFGAGTAAYQIEGGWKDDGKGESIWDRWTHMPGNTKDNADVACDHCHRWKEDVGLMKQLNLQAYRFSISWPRVLPNGIGSMNQKGMDFYKNLVDELLQNGITPAITLFHWDLPQKLQEKGGWANRDIAKWFGDYAELMFRNLGDRVPLWTTHNEPWVFTIASHTYGKNAPGIKDKPTALLTTHNCLLAHGQAVSAFRASAPTGKIGITLSTSWCIPENDNDYDRKAAELMRRSHIEWYSDPIYRGTYPEDVWEKYVNAGIPMFDIEPGDMDIIKQKIDFLGLDYYGPNIVKHDPSDYWPYGVTFLNKRNILGSDLWNSSELTNMLVFISNRYQSPDIIITENGHNGADSDYLDSKKRIMDIERIEYTWQHIKAIHDAIKQGVKMKGYMHWSFIDNFEWGWWSRMGLVYRDYKTNDRYIKESGKWYADCIKKGYFYLNI